MSDQQTDARHQNLKTALRGILDLYEQDNERPNDIRLKNARDVLKPEFDAEDVEQPVASRLKTNGFKTAISGMISIYDRDDEKVNDPRIQHARETLLNTKFW